MRTKNSNLAGSGLQYTGNYLKQRAFSGAVGSYNCDSLSGVKVEGDLLERRPPVITYTDILHVEDGLIQFMVGMGIYALYLTFSQQDCYASKQLLKSLDDFRHIISHHIKIGGGGTALRERFEMKVTDDLHGGFHRDSFRQIWVIRCI